MACGRPAIALSRGGTLDTVVHGRTGLLVDELSVDAFAAAMAAVEGTAFDPAEIRAHAEPFDTSRFEQVFARLIAEALTEQRAAC
jgi:glycosyltransferase involved in cell wall biosynthesis